jgi:cobalt-zinc-cadmium efflux system outer membrane protein
MKQTIHGICKGVHIVVALTALGASIQVYAESQGNRAWPATYPLGRDIPVNRGGPASEDPATHVVAPQEPEGVLTLQQALALALAHSPELAASAHGVWAAEGSVEQAGARPNPELEIEASEFGGWGTRRELAGPEWPSGVPGTPREWHDLASAVYAARQGAGEAGTRQGYDAAQTTVSLGQSIELGGKRDKRQRVARAEARLAGWEYETKRLDVLTQTKKSFVDVLLAQGRLASAESLLLLAADLHKAAAERVQSGKVALLEETKAGIEVTSARIARDRARRELDTARNRLASAWGGTVPAFSEAGGALDKVRDAPLSKELASVPDNLPEVARWQEQVAIANESLVLAQAGRLPDLNVSAGITRFEEDYSYAAKAAISMPLPIFNRNGGNIRAAEHLVTRAKYEQQAARLRATTDLVDAHNQLEATRTEALAIQADLLPGSQKAADAAQTAYREGKLDLLDTLDAKRTLGEAKARYLDVLAAYHKAVADVERLTGFPVDNIQ